MLPGIRERAEQLDNLVRFRDRSRMLAVVNCR
jgi:hypothetical protein